MAISPTQQIASSLIALQTDKKASAALPTKVQSDRLPWTGAKLDPALFKRLNKLTVPQLINTLRNEFGIKIFILDVKVPDEIGNAVSLANLDVKKDAQAHAYYQRNNADEFKVTGAAAITVPAYSYDNVEQIGKRPYADHHIILLPRAASKSVILHEFGHCEIHRQLFSKPVNYNGQRVHRFFLKDQELKQGEKLLHELESKHKTSKILSQVEMQKLLRIGTTALKQFSQNKGQELDICRFFLEHRNDFSSTDMEVMQQLGYYGLNFEEKIKPAIEAVTDKIARLPTSAYKLAEFKPYMEEATKAGKLMQESQKWFDDSLNKYTSLIQRLAPIIERNQRRQ